MILVIKRWLARKIGAVIVNDLPADIQAELIYRAGQHTLDDIIKGKLKAGFKVEHVK